MSSEDSNLFNDLVIASRADDGGEQLLKGIYRRVHEQYPHFYLTDRQIRSILEAVPEIFPPNWDGAGKPPGCRFSEAQKRHLMHILRMDGRSCASEALQLLIREAALSLATLSLQHRDS